MQNLENLLTIAKEAALKGGREILKFYDAKSATLTKDGLNLDKNKSPYYKKPNADTVNSYQIRIKPDKSPVTIADLASNEIIFKTLSKSGLPICSEEQILSPEAVQNGNDNAQKTDSLFWLIDPLDGTNDFISGVGEFCVCIALIKDSRPILGVIYIPVSNELFYAAKGYGSHFENPVNFSPFQDSDAAFSNQNLKNLIDKTGKNLIAISRYGKNKIPLELANRLNLEPLRLSSAIKFCKIASGHAKIYARFSPSSIWDNAAGDIIAEESGAKIIDLATQKAPIYDVENLKSNEFIVIANEFLEKKSEILDLIATFKSPNSQI